MSRESLTIQLAKDRARSQLYRERKRNEAIDLAIDTTQTTLITTKPKEPEQNAFSTRQAYHRGIKNAEKYVPFTLHKKWSSPLMISSVNVAKSAVSCGFGHIYWINP